MHDTRHFQYLPISSNVSDIHIHPQYLSEWKVPFLDINYTLSWNRSWQRRESAVLIRLNWVNCTWEFCRHHSGRHKHLRPSRRTDSDKNYFLADPSRSFVNLYESSRNPRKSRELWQLSAQLWFLCFSVQAPQSGVAEAAAALAAALATFAGSGVSVQVGAVYITVPKLGCTSRPLLYQSRCVEFKWPVLFGPCKASQEVVRRRYRCKDRLWKRVEKNT